MDLREHEKIKSNNFKKLKMKGIGNEISGFYLCIGFSLQRIKITTSFFTNNGDP
jgi:hypothetical protein